MPLAPNPYRERFYALQHEWHGSRTLTGIEEDHRRRAPYYGWYTQGWLNSDKDAPILEIGCGAGQFLHFLRQRGFRNAVGIDVDACQVALARKLGHTAFVAEAESFLNTSGATYEAIFACDVLEHFTRLELAALLDAAAGRLRIGGSLIGSVVCVDSPQGLRTWQGDITHEIAFTTTSLRQALACHGLTLTGLRDPFPAPVSPARRVYRQVTLLFRALESLRLRALGLAPPVVWSPVVWFSAARLPGGTGATRPSGS